MSNCFSRKKSMMEKKKIRRTLFFELGLAVVLLIAPRFFSVGIGPKYFLCAIPALPLFYSAYRTFVRLKKTSWILRLRETWGVPSIRKRDFDEISAHFRITRNEHADGDILDDRTWSDLDLDMIYAKLDRTTTNPGEKILYTILRRPALEAGCLRERKKWISLFAGDRIVREKVQTVLAGLSRDSAESSLELLWGDAPSKIPGASFFVCFVVLVPILLFLILTRHNWAIGGLLAVFAGHMILHYRAKRVTQDHFASVRCLGRMVALMKKLMGLNLPELKEFLDDLGPGLEAASSIARQTAMLMPEGRNAIYDYINIIFLIEARAFNAVLKSIEKNRQIFRNIYERVGLIDAMLSVASFRAGLDRFCEPRFSDSGSWLKIDGGVHPLVEKPVPNSLSLDSKNILITGSNMSGKTTFLKTVGVNAVLAQTIFTCTAENYQASFFRVMTLIGRKDNLIEGKSYYLDEIQALLRILKSKNESTAHLILLDELFRGTNSTERIAASVEVLLYLKKGCGCALASTHDLEIPGLLGSLYRNVHFREEVEENGLAFHYKLMDGPSTTRNAIKLLRHVGFPDEIVDGAEKRVRP
jgi:hypothetical protein